MMNSIRIELLYIMIYRKYSSYIFRKIFLLCSQLPGGGGSSMPGVLWQWTLDSDYQSVTSTISVSVGNHCHQHTHYTDFIQTLYSDIHVYYTVTTTRQTRSEWSTEGLLWWVFLWPVIQSLLCEVFQMFHLVCWSPVWWRCLHSIFRSISSDNDVKVGISASESCSDCGG